MKRFVYLLLFFASTSVASETEYFKTIDDLIAVHGNKTTFVSRHSGSDYDPLYMYEGHYYVSGVATELSHSYGLSLYPKCYLGNPEDLEFVARKAHERNGVHYSYKVKMTQVNDTQISLYSIEEKRYYNRGQLDTRPFSRERSPRDVLLNHCSAL